jgi:hypothetical protein
MTGLCEWGDCDSEETCTCSRCGLPLCDDCHVNAEDGKGHPVSACPRCLDEVSRES